MKFSTKYFRHKLHKITNLNDVVAWRLCLGCGACSYVCREGRVQLYDFESEGIRPIADPKNYSECLDICPVVSTDFGYLSDDDFTKNWGRVLYIWEGHACDPETRFMGSSGGIITAIATYCIEKLGMHGTLHVAQDPDDPVRNQTRLSYTRAELLKATGSRYSPGSVCNGLHLVERAPNSCVIVGRPVEIAAVENVRKLRPDLDRKIGVTLSFFCAESPSTRGTIELLKKIGIDASSLSDLRYRGNGWPGYFAPRKTGGSEPKHKMSYRDSWAFLRAFRPWSAQMWPDCTGELADISCGDAWHRDSADNPGLSLVLVRTERGRAIIDGAIASGYLSLTKAETWMLEKSQGGLLKKKGSVWGRRLALRIFGLPVTRFDGLDLRHCWLQLPTEEKLRSTLGTIRRIVSRRLSRPLNLDMRHCTPIKSPYAKPYQGSKYYFNQ